MTNSGRTGTAWRRWLCGGLLLAMLVGIGAYGLLGYGTGGVQAGGAPAPDATLVTADGEFRLAAARGTILVLYFSFPG